MAEAAAREETAMVGTRTSFFRRDRRGDRFFVEVKEDTEDFIDKQHICSGLIERHLCTVKVARIYAK